MCGGVLGEGEGEFRGRIKFENEWVFLDPSDIRERNPLAVSAFRASLIKSSIQNFGCHVEFHLNSK